MIADLILDFAEYLGKEIAKGIKLLFSSSGNKQTSAPVGEVQQPVTNTSDIVVYRIKPFKDNTAGTSYWQQYLKSFMDVSQSIQYVLVGNRATTSMFAIVPASIALYFQNVFYANFPTSELLREAYVPAKPAYWISYGDKPSLMSDKDYMKEGSYLDPMKDMFGIFDNVDTTDTLTISYYYQFKKEKSKWDAISAAIGKMWKKITEKPEAEKTDAEKEKPEDAIKCSVSIGVVYQPTTTQMAQGVKLTMKALFSKYIHKGSVTVTPERKSTICTLSQVVNFFHLPTTDYSVKSLDYCSYRKLPYPSNLPSTSNTNEKNGLTLLGKTQYRGQEVRFGIKDEDTFRHLYVVGKTGTGKSTFLSNMIKSHMYTNKGLCLIDPHGDLVETVLEHVPSRRTNDVILFDVADTENPIGFNLLSYRNQEEKNLIVSGIVGTFKKLYDTSWGPRLEYILRNVLLAIVEYPNATMMHIVRMLTDKNFKEEVLEHVTDPIVLKFWREEYDKWTDKFRDEAIAPITNKIGQFISSPVVRNIFGQPSSKLNLRKVMDEGKILLVNLSKGRIGEDNTEMIGSFLVTKLQIEAMSRADIDFKDRRDFYLYIDEFQNFATDSFAVILSEARKYKLALVVANQYTSQLSEKIRDAIFGNVGTIISFTLGYDDAVVMSSQFKEMVSPNDLLSVPKFCAYIKLMIDGIVSDPFSMTTLPLTSPEQSIEIKDKIRAQSRQRYAMERSRLEDLIKVWSNKTFSKVEKAVEKAMAEANGTPIPKPMTQGTVQAPPPASSPAQSTAPMQVNSVGIPMVAKTSFTIADVVLGERYDGIVKLKYNYGLFIIVKGVEGLLHKNFIQVPDGINWKDVYNIGDKIRVKASEFKQINGEKRIVWSQV